MKLNPITRNLKYASFIYDPKTKLFDIYLIDPKTQEQRHAKTNLVYAMAFCRFVLRIIQSGKHKIK